MYNLKLSKTQMDFYKTVFTNDWLYSITTDMHVSDTKKRRAINIKIYTKMDIIKAYIKFDVRYGLFVLVKI